MPRMEPTLILSLILYLHPRIHVQSFTHTRIFIYTTRHTITHNTYTHDHPSPPPTHTYTHTHTQTHRQEADLQRCRDQKAQNLAAARQRVLDRVIADAHAVAVHDARGKEDRKEARAGGKGVCVCVCGVCLPANTKQKTAPVWFGYLSIAG